MGWEDFLSWKRKFHCVDMSNRVVCERKPRHVAKILGGGGRGGGGRGQALSTSRPPRVPGQQEGRVFSLPSLRTC